MIYLIGGCMRSGKTTTARRLARRLRIAWIQTDSLRFVARAYIPKKELYKKLPFKKMDNLAGHLVFEKYTSKENIKAEITEAKTIWPGVKAFLKHVWETKEDCVIEGVHLLPSLINELKKQPYFKDLKIVFLVKTDLQCILDGFSKNKARHDWIAEYTKTEKSRLGAAQWVQEGGRYFEKEAKKYGFKSITTDQNFQKNINKAMTFLLTNK